MIAYVILRPDGTEVEGSVAHSEAKAWLRAHDDEDAVVCNHYRYPGKAMRKLGYRLHSFEVPLPQAEEKP